jgi:[ribosomal protein S5]-alanine N-acetyltransferase
VTASRNYFLTTDRLAFSHWQPHDLPLATKLWGDPKVSSLIGGLFTPEGVIARLKREIGCVFAYKIQYWPIFLLSDGQLAGCAGLRPYKNEDTILEMGVHLRPEYWGQGLVQEAGRAVIIVAFETLGVKSLFAGHHPANTASRRLIEKLGFLFTHEEFYPLTGLNHPSYLLANPGISREVG